MSAKKKTKQNTTVSKKTKAKEEVKAPAQKVPKSPVIAAEHLPPLPLVFTVLACSGALWILGLRDMAATGKNILGEWDNAYLGFTKSTHWYDDSKGWKSTMGGFSSIEYITTDANNMGGLFVRKLGGAAALSVHMHKLLPLLFHPSDAKWNHGHFRPLLITALFCNLATLAFYGDYLEDLVLAEADALPKLVMFLLAVETMVIGYYLMTQKKLSTGPAVAMPKGKTPSSVPSRIVMRTVGIISPVIVLVAGRDLFFPGHILSFFPRDDIYLEWTGAFFHSPPEGSPEATEQGLEAPLYVGEKFIAQLMALHLLLLCVYKFVSSFLVKIRSDGSGFISSRMMWRGAAIGGGLVVLMFRLFKHAATSASWDTSWHLMTLAYEAFILGLQGFN